MTVEGAQCRESVGDDVLVRGELVVWQSLPVGHTDTLQLGSEELDLRIQQVSCCSIASYYDS
jgi:hypothetical protein